MGQRPRRLPLPPLGKDIQAIRNINSSSSNLLPYHIHLIRAQ
jgi:hypothetical protein